MVGGRTAVPHPGVRDDPPRAAVVHPVRHDLPLRERRPGDGAGLALEAADGKDVRLGGGADTVRQFLDAGLIDTLHVAVAPVELGAGSRLWASPEELLDRYHRDVVPSPSGVVHHLFWRV